MKVFPKIDQTLVGYEVLRDFIKEGVEIQLLSADTNNLDNILKTLHNDAPNLKVVTLHLPMSYCDIEILLSNEENMNYIKDMIKFSINKAEEYNLSINVLAHCNWTLAMMKRSGKLTLLKSLLNLIDGSSVKLLLENGMTKLENPTTINSALEVCMSVNNPNLKMCLDICHMHSYLNMSRTPKDIASYIGTNKLSDIVEQIHFSAALNSDGFKDIKHTHGKSHECVLKVLEDISILIDRGLSDTNLVIEICEDDYRTRIGQLKELDLVGRCLLY